MQRYFGHLLVACLLGLCKGDTEDNPTTQTPHCVCKPVMRLEWEPTSSICNNATFDWLLQTVLSQVTKQNEDLTSQTTEIERLTTEVTEKDEQLSQLQKEVDRLSASLAELTTKNRKLEADLEDSKQHTAHLNPHPLDCADVQRYGFHYSGIYTVYPRGYPQGVEVFCDLNTDGGGWLVFQRRQDGSQTFDKLWDDYKVGFGKVAKEFWLGNDRLHDISSQRQYELRVDLTDFQGKQYHATYDMFVVENEQNKYTLHVGEYSGDAGDALRHHNHSPFSTTDNDNDQSRSGNCAELYGKGGWWFVRCYDSNLNGLYSNRHLYETIVWYQLRRNHEPMRHTEMKIRPKNF